MDLAFLWLFLVVFLAHFTEAVLGFGCGLLTLALASYPLSVLLPVIIPLNLILSLSILSRDRQAISPVLWKKMLPWAGLGLPLGFALFRTLPERQTRVLFGAVLLGLTLWGIWRSRTKASTLSPLPAWQANFFLFGGGLIQGLYATGGPFIVYVVSRLSLDKRTFRATLAGLWFLLNVTVFLGMLVRSEYTAQHGWLFLGTLPAVLLGLFVGERFHHSVDERIFAGLVQALLLFAGVRFLLSS
ncbi:sulfite exporter TauE/SafE family protein [Myxococcota bacterium]|nr:sulfite exporter TauE/SafE family protein [Myxococcota bacterium]